MKDVNSNSFEFNSNGFELELDKRRSKNVQIFGGAPENDEIIYWTTFEVKDMGNYFASVFMGDSELVQYLI